MKEVDPPVDEKIAAAPSAAVSMSDMMARLQPVRDEFLDKMSDPVATDAREIEPPVVLQYCELDLEHLPEIGDLYSKLLIEDEALDYFHERAQAEIAGNIDNESDAEMRFADAIKRRGFLNEWESNPAVIAKYREFCRGYISVREETQMDLEGTSGKPGIFRMCGLRGSDGQLLCSVSSREPDPECPDAYLTYNKEVLRQVWRPEDLPEEAKLEQWAMSEEIDTVASLQGGLATALMLLRWEKQQRAIDERKKAGGKFYPVTRSIFRRFGNLQLLEPIKGEPYLGNHKSASYFTGLGYADFGERCGPGDVMVRFVKSLNAFAVVKTPWVHGRAKIFTAMDQAKQKLEKFGIKIEGDTVIVPQKRKVA